MYLARATRRQFLLLSAVALISATIGTALAAWHLHPEPLSSHCVALVLLPLAALALVVGWGAVYLRPVPQPTPAGNGLDSANHQFRRLLETMEMVPWEADIHSWRYRYVGPQAEKLLGYLVDDWYQPNFWVKHICAPDRDAVVARCAAACASREPAELEYRMVRRDGAIIWVQNYLSLPRSRSGTHVFRGCIVDITARKQAEEKLRQSEKMQAINRVAGSAAHDFNNMLMAINAYADTLMRQPLLTVSMRDEVCGIQRAVQQARTLVRQLLAFQDGAGGTAQRLDLAELLRGMERMLRALLEGKYRLQLEVGAGPVWVDADPVEIERAVLNLVVNARDAMPDGGTLTIAADTTPVAGPGQKASAATPQARLSVADTGVGMTEDVRQKLFEPFYSTKGEKGTGLGLYSVYTVVRKYGGHIDVHSTPGAGSRFDLYLPAASAPAASDGPGDRHAAPVGPDAPVPAANGTPASPGHMSRPTILVVEDEQLVRPIYRRMLESDGYRVLEADDGRQAVHLCEAHAGPIDLMVTDVMMPQMDGFELARRLKEQRPTLKVLYVTGFADTTEMSRRQGVSPDNLLQKPFNPENLVCKVRELLAAS